LKLTFFRALSKVLVLLCFLPYIPLVHAANRTRDLSPRYRQWLNEEVTYIITTDEKKHFLSLTNDAERDDFITTFWKIRNPNPGSETNSYKDEHYRRLAYANEHFGSIGLHNGWHTDQGRIYITLGAPQQVESYLAARNVRPIEIWFYQSPSLALPAFFNILFFKRDAGEPFTLYSPRSDGPAHLVSSLEALNDQKKSLDILRKSLGDEVATTTISLIPGEDVDLDEFEPSLSSDLLLSEIEGLPDNPVTKEQLEVNRVREHVTMSMFLPGQDTTFSYATFRDDRGQLTLSYLLSMQYPDPNLVRARPDGSGFYNLTLRTDILTAAGKPVYDQQDELTGNLAAAQIEMAKKKRFGAEGRLPLAPGTYKLVTTLTNNLNEVATRQQATVTMPALKGDGMAISSVVAYTMPAAIPDARGDLPFSASHYRFTPRAAGNIYLRQGERLPLVFQLWLDPKKAAAATPEKIHLHYVFGSIVSPTDQRTVEDEEIDAGNRDEAGNLLTGHTLDTSTLSPGFYQAVISANRSGEHQTAYATLNLKVLAAADFVDLWTAYGPESPGGVALDDYKHGLAAAAQGDHALAETAFDRALADGSAEMRPLNRLAAMLDRDGQTERLAALSQLTVLNKVAANPATLLTIVRALNKLGNPKATEHLLETQVALQPPNADLYGALADAYEASGNTARAREVRALATNTKQ
jgi:GWxTD domain-containing protein